MHGRLGSVTHKETGAISETERFARLDWKGRGYFGFPLPQENRPANAHEWRDFERILEQVRRGDFQETPRLLELYDSCEGWLLSRAYITLLGDAAPASLFRKLAMMAEPSDVFPVYYEVAFCRALTDWGQLSVVPVMLGVLERSHEYQDADELPDLLSWILEETPGAIAERPDEDHLEEYRTRVLHRYEELKQRFGTDQVLLCRGERFSVGRLARLILQSLDTGRLDPYLRRRFEASAGVDCTAFYQDERLQPRAAAALVESFLQGPEVARYQEGVRYFFGHRLEED